MRRRSATLAHVLWFVGGFGVLGLHRFYLGRHRSAALYVVTLGLLGVGAAWDLLRLPVMVERANQPGKPEEAAVFDPYWPEGLPTPMDPTAPKSRYRPKMARGWIVAATVLLSVGLAARTVGAGGAGQAVFITAAYVIAWAIALVLFSVGVLTGAAFLPASGALHARFHHWFSLRSPGEPEAMLVEVEGSGPREDPVPDEAFLPLAVASAISFAVVDEGPLNAVGVLVNVLGGGAVPFLTGLVLPLLRVPPATRFRSARVDREGRIHALRPLGGGLVASFGFVAFVATLAQASLSSPRVLGMVLPIALPIVFGTHLYLEGRLRLEVRRFESFLGRRHRGPIPRLPLPAAPAT
ncbi:MAG: TM2 domain-containing protein [Methanobacteriota archaeon]